MSHYDYTKARVLQWLGIILIIGVFAGAYWYFQVRASTVNQSKNDSLTSGLAGFWSFNGDDMSGTTATDRSGNGLNGTLTNSPTKVTGKVSQALDFDGTDDYVTVADNASLDFGDTADLSLSGWFYRDSFTTDDTIIAKRNGIVSTDTGYLAYIDDATDQLIFEVSDGTDEYSLTSVQTFTTAGWYHYAIVWDQDSATNAEIYINGIAERATDTGTIGNIGDLSNALTLRVGTESDNGNPFDGKVDEVRVYSRVLTSGEIESLYNQGGGTKVNSAVSQSQGAGRLDSGLTRYWPLDDGSGTSATDASTNGSTGTLTNGPTWTTGQIGGAVDFDGTDDYVDIGTTTTYVSTTAPFSVALWLNPDVFIGANNTPFTLKTDSTTGWSGTMFNDVSYRDFTFGKDNASSMKFSFPGGVTTGNWYHVVITYNGNGFNTTTNYTASVNGTNVPVAATGTLTTIDNESYIGRLKANAGVNNYYWNGKLDEFRLYNYALSADEVSQLYRLTAPTGVDTGLNGYWSFDGKSMSGTTAFDRSGAGNTGTLTNSPTKVTGKVSQALDFDGTDDYVTVADNASLDFGDTADLSLSGWFYRDSFTTDDTIIAKRNGIVSTDTGYLAYIDDATDQLIFEVSDGTDEYSLTSVQTFTTAGWYHYAIVWDQDSATNSELYVNGVADRATDTGTIANIGDLSNALTLRVGTESDNGNPFDGKVDEVRVYSRVLTSGEIESLYGAGKSDEVNSSVSQPQGVGRLDSGLAGYWPLDNGSGTSATDNSTNGNTGTLTNGPTWTTGQIGGAVDFDGTDDTVSIGTDTSLVLTTSLTISAWIYMDAIPASGGGHYIFCKHSSGDTNFLYSLNVRNQAGVVTAQFFPGGGGSASLSNSVLAASRWYHIVVTFNRPTVSIYINGALDAVRTDSVASFPSGSGTAQIGSGFGGGQFDARIDEVRVYNRPLSPDEVAQLYRLTAPTGVDTGLKGYWPLDGRDVVGTTAYDRSGKGSSGVLAGGPTRTIGKLGQGLFFDGVNDEVSMGSLNYIDGVANVTLSGWFKRNAVSNLVTVGNADTSSGRFNINFFGDGNVYMNVGDCSTTPYGYFASNDTNWHHVVMVYDGSQSGNANRLKVYMDGTAQSLTFNGTIPATTCVSSTDEFRLGRNAVSTTFSTGKIDEVRLYTRSLTEAEAISLYNSSR